MTATLTDAQIQSLREAIENDDIIMSHERAQTILALLAERDALRADLAKTNEALGMMIKAGDEQKARAEAAEADAARLRKALEAAGDALEKLAGAEALTVPFYLKDNNEGRELNARRDYAAEHFRAAREAAALTTKGTAE